MTAKKSTATKAAAKTEKVSGIGDFKKRKEGSLVTLPSGLTILGRRVELRSFLEQGDVPNPLIAVVEEALNKGSEADIDQITGFGTKGVDMDMVRDMYQMVDNVVVSVMVEPQCHPKPEDGVERDDNLLYVDEVDDEDKMFLFQWCTGGTSDLATFREGAKADLVRLAQK